MIIDIEMFKVSYYYFLLVLVMFFSGCFSVSTKDGIAGYDQRYMNAAQVTSDIKIVGTVKGTGTRNELFGLIKWGDRGRASYEGQYQDYRIDDEMSLISKQSAVYDALGGQPENFLLDPQFHTETNNFLIFKSYKTKVVGQQASKGNYRQVKRFNTDGTDTLELDRLPHTYTIKRNGQEATKIVASRDIPNHITNSIRVLETTPGVKAINMSANSHQADSGSLNSSLEAFEIRMQELSRKIEALNR